MNITSQFEQKTFSCRRLETKRRSVRNGDFGFRRKAQVRTFLHLNIILSVPCKGDTTRGKGKLKQGQKTAFPFPLMVSLWLCKRQALISSLNPIHNKKLPSISHRNVREFPLQMFFAMIISYNSESLFFKLQLLQSVCKLSIVVSPPFAHGLTWSICNSSPGVLAGERPHMQHLKLSRFKT